MFANALEVYLFISIVTITFFAAYLLSRSKVPYVKALLLLSLCIDIYIFGYGAELISTTLGNKLFWNAFEYVGIPFVAALWLTTTLLFTEHFFPFTKWKFLLLFGIPIATLILRFTNDFHHLYFISISTESFGNVVFLTKEKGIWFLVQSLHSATLIAIAFVLHIITFKRKKEPSSEKSLYMLFASAIAFMGLLFNVIKIGGIGIDYMVIFLPITVGFVVTAILRNDFLETKILARDIIFEKNSQGMILLNNGNRILDYNEAAYAIFAQQGIMLRKDFVDAVFANEGVLKKIIMTPETETWKASNTNGIKYYDILTSNLQRNNGSIYGKMKTIYDITERQTISDHLKVLATTDELSGLMNRRAFVPLAEAQLKRGAANHKIFYLLMMDLDFFKNINDTYGHMIGDDVIESFGRLLRQHFESPDLIGRMGGEEFTVLMESENITTAFTKTDNFRKLIADTDFDVEKGLLPVTVSIGVAEAENDNKNISQLITMADKALYAAKNSGRNKTMVYNKSFFFKNQTKNLN